MAIVFFTKILKQLKGERVVFSANGVRIAEQSHAINK